MCGRRYHYHHDHRSDVVATPRIKVEDVRASDAEREEVVTALRTLAVDGRLDVDELNQRIEAPYPAKTRRELTVLTDDLPRARRARRDEGREFAEHLRFYLSLMARLV